MPKARSAVWNNLTRRAPLTVYQTDFLGTENPIKEGQVWVGGLEMALDYNNAQKEPGRCYGTAINPVDTFADSLACLNRDFFAVPANQRVRVIVGIQSGYAPSDSHEIEIHHRCNVGPNIWRSFEVLIPFGSGGQVVYQPGGIGNYQVLDSTGTVQNLAHGDEIISEMIGSTITVYHNGDAAFTCTDARLDNISSGQPGMGFFCRTGGTLRNFYISHWECEPIV